MPCSDNNSYFSYGGETIRYVFDPVDFAFLPVPNIFACPKFSADKFFMTIFVRRVSKWKLLFACKVLKLNFINGIKMFRMRLNKTKKREQKINKYKNCFAQKTIDFWLSWNFMRTTKDRKQRTHTPFTVYMIAGVPLVNNTCIFQWKLFIFFFVSFFVFFLNFSLPYLVTL